MINSRSAPAILQKKNFYTMGHNGLNPSLDHFFYHMYKLITLFEIYPHHPFVIFWCNKLNLTPLEFASDINNIISQLYLYQSIEPGEEVYLISENLIKKNHRILITREINGEYACILKVMKETKSKFYRFQKILISPWDPINALKIRCQRFLQNYKQQVPSHLTLNIAENPELIDDCINMLLETDNTDLAIDDPTDARILVINQEAAGVLIKTEMDEYRLLFISKHEDKPFIRLDSNKESVWYRIDGVFIELEAKLFLSRIQTAKSNLWNYLLPDKLSTLITNRDLLTLYNHVLYSKIFRYHLQAGKPFRIAKEISGLARTINIIRDKEGHFALMLETKSKKSNGKKSKHCIIGRGSYGIVKAAWQLDTTRPKEWVNKVSIKEDVIEASYETVVTQALTTDKKASSLFNVTLLGQAFTKHATLKQSQYSERAVGDLYQLIERGVQFLGSDINRITQNLLDAVEHLHSQGKVHQDIKHNNVFIYLDAQGFYAKLADLGSCTDLNIGFNTESRATTEFESPEILLAYEAPGTSHHDYFYKNATDDYIKEHSYAFKMLHTIARSTKNYDLQTQQYSKAHCANDIWALGITLFYLQHSRLPKFDSMADKLHIELNPLLKGMLTIDRNQRFTIQEAKACFIEMNTLPEVLKISNSFITHFNSKKAQEVNLEAHEKECPVEKFSTLTM